ncbi:MAG TPA: hypothetical protein VFU59_00525, partial [Candidatus Eisenbacteria bacterium]|nr:hypothetical protein [Candidatus Eisenbacteria bacterium]
FPKGSQLVVSFGTRGIRGVQSAIAEGQAPSLWYGDPSLRAVALAERTPPAGREFFVRVTNGLDVIAFDLDPFDIRSTLAAAPDLSEIDQPLSRYAREVAAGGETDRAIRIVEGLNRIESGDLIQYNRRMIASMLLAAGRRPEADSLLASTAPFPREVAIDLVVRIQAEATSNEALDLAAFEAFDLSASDPATLRAVMQKMQRVGTLGQAAWWAERLGRLAPGDTGAAEVLRAAAAKGIPPRREPPRRVASPHANGA